MSYYDIPPRDLVYNQKSGMYEHKDRIISSQYHADKFYFELSAMLAPENIHEDGQISLYAADIKHKRILKTIKKLNKHFTPPEALRDESDEPDAFFEEE
jgi:hypothetical protein